MSPEERKAFFENRKAEWEKMSDADKLKKIEEHRAKRKAYFEQKEAEWEKMSDAEKIKHVEEKMKRMHDGKKGHHGPRGEHEAE